MATVRVTYLKTVGVDKDDSDPEVANAVTLFQRAQTALSNNQNFLALTSPTNAQTLAQVKALTRQTNGLMRFLLDEFDSISDS